MKDYSKNYDESKIYIKSYKILNDKIIVELASYESYIIPYSKENEQKIISKMEEQARNAEIKKPSALDLSLMIIQPLNLPLAIINFIKYGGWDYGIILGIIAATAIWYPTKVITLAKRTRDIKKLNYFLDHKKELNEGFGKSENIKLGLSQKTIKQIEVQKSNNKEPFNINNIDNYSLSDLKIIKENIERMTQFGFNETPEVTKEQPLILKRTLDNKRK